jgi:hypothetical protein
MGDDQKVMSFPEPKNYPEEWDQWVKDRDDFDLFKELTGKLIELLTEALDREKEALKNKSFKEFLDQGRRGYMGGVPCDGARRGNDAHVHGIGIQAVSRTDPAGPSEDTVHRISDAPASVD